MEYKKSDLTNFAKDLVFAHKTLFNAMCISEEIAKSKIGRELRDDNQELLLEISKRFAKYARDEGTVDLDNGDVQTCQNIINDILICCNENNWFK